MKGSEIAPTAAVKTVFMFSGQGSQYYQMGRTLFEREPVFRETMSELDQIVERLSDRSVVHELYHSGRVKSDPFKETRITHPAIVMVEYSITQVLASRGMRPDVALGASLGSFAAAAVCGLLSIEGALGAAIEHARCLEERCPPGAMIAVLASPELYEQELAFCSELVGVNFSSHFVVATVAENVVELETKLRSRGIAFQTLPVCFAFHSRWIESARQIFCGRQAPRLPLSRAVPLACCAHARVLDGLPADYFWTVARQPIRFRETIAVLETSGPYRYVDVGPAGTLATFLKYVLPPTSRSSAHSILSPYDRDVANVDALAPKIAAES